MAPRKIIFLVIVGIVGIVILYLLWNLSQAQQKEKAETVDSLSVWVVGDTSKQYENLFSRFAETDKRYKDIKIEVRVFPDYEKYQRILLSTLAEGNGPDIFMVEGGGDDVLASKVEPIPDSVIDLSNFEREYEDIFLPLSFSEGEKEEMTRYLVGVPLGYETLGVFYHKSLVESFPKTWSELSTMNIVSKEEVLVTSNLGLSPIYTDGATDILAYFIGKGGSRSITNLMNGGKGIEEYMNYGFINKNDESSIGGLKDVKTTMEQESLTTIDMFMRGKIALLIGFPSTIREIEKAEKRAGDDLFEGLILTERLPQDSLGEKRSNIARYRYLGISNKTQKPLASVDLLKYIMSDTGRALVRENFPLLISPIRGEGTIQKNTALSKVFARTRLDVFIPALDEEIFFYDYGLKSEYEKIFREYIDRNDFKDINKMIKLLQKNIPCELAAQSGGKVDESCLIED